MAEMFTPQAKQGAGGFPAASKRPGVIKTRLFTTTGTWTCPANVYWVQLQMCGGGGGGGGTPQAEDDLSGSFFGASGDGGGGGAAVAGAVAVTPGVVYTATVGAAGAGGTAGSNPGLTGGTSSFVGSDGIRRVFAPGGQGGAAGLISSTPAVRVPSSGGYRAPATTFYGTSIIPGGLGGCSGTLTASSVTVPPIESADVDGVPGGALGTANNNAQRSGPGGASAFGRGAVGAVATAYNQSTVGIAATEFGGGGSGAAAGKNNLARAGGSGFAGFVHLTWEE
jgi:hypothetical protein